MSIKNWSTSAGNNNAAVPYGAPEGWNSSQVNDTLRQCMADIRDTWENRSMFDYGDSPTYVSATSFTVSGDITSRPEIANLSRIQAVISTGTIQGIITSASYSSSTGLTTVNVTWDGTGALSSPISSVQYGIDIGALDILTKAFAATLYAGISNVVNSFNGRQGAVTLTNADITALLTGADVKSALGLTPVGNTTADIEAALGFTPVGNTAADIKTALGYTPVSTDAYFGVGCFVMGYLNSSTSVSQGGTIAGSSVLAGGVTTNGSAITGTSLSGTWRMLGGGGSGVDYNSVLQRVA